MRCMQVLFVKLLQCVVELGLPMFGLAGIFLRREFLQRCLFFLRSAKLSIIRPVLMSGTASDQGNQFAEQWNAGLRNIANKCGEFDNAMPAKVFAVRGNGGRTSLCFGGAVFATWRVGKQWCVGQLAVGSQSGHFTQALLHQIAKGASNDVQHRRRVRPIATCLPHVRLPRLWIIRRRKVATAAWLVAGGHRHPPHLRA